MLCASGPNLQKQFKHQRLLLLLSCFVAELPVFFYFSATYLRAKAATCTAVRVKQVIDTSLRSQAPLQAQLLCSAWITLFDFPSPSPGPSRNAIAESY